MTDKRKTESVGLMIRHKVGRGHAARYEAWLNDITAAASGSEGHQGAQIIRPLDDRGEYLTIVRFASATAADAWARSEERRRLVAEIADALDTPEKPEIRPGVEFWFAPPPGQRSAKPWKQWLVTTSVIWPISTLVQFLSIPFFEHLPVLGIWGVRQGIVTVIVVAIVVFLVMPRYVRAVAGWLYR